MRVERVAEAAKENRRRGMHSQCSLKFKKDMQVDNKWLSGEGGGDMGKKAAAWMHCSQDDSRRVWDSTASSDHATHVIN